MTAISSITRFLDEFAPLGLAENWDNVGLLLGDRAAPVSRIMTCLTLTPDVAAEAIRERVELVVTHHPILFKAVKHLTADDVAGRMVLELIKAQVAVYSPHTAFDSAPLGINQQLAETLGLADIRPLRCPNSADPLVGAGRYGSLAVPLHFADFLTTVAQSLGLRHVQYSGDEAVMVTRVAVACGAAAEFLVDARGAGCQVLVTGEARFHDCLEAQSQGPAMVLLGHYGSERPGIERLAAILAMQFPELTVWPSRDERDPLTLHR